MYDYDIICRATHDFVLSNKQFNCVLNIPPISLIHCVGIQEHGSPSSVSWVSRWLRYICSRHSISQLSTRREWQISALDFPEMLMYHLPKMKTFIFSLKSIQSSKERRPRHFSFILLSSDAVTEWYFYFPNVVTRNGMRIFSFKSAQYCYSYLRHRDGLVVSVAASYVVGRGFAPWLGHIPKTIIKMVQTASLLGTQAFG